MLNNRIKTKPDTMTIKSIQRKWYISQGLHKERGFEERFKRSNKGYHQPVM